MRVYSEKLINRIHFQLRVSLFEGGDIPERFLPLLRTFPRIFSARWKVFRALLLENKPLLLTPDYIFNVYKSGKYDEEKWTVFFKGRASDEEVAVKMSCSAGLGV